ncbi:MAG TPA: hypothetical protein VE618_10770 [Myxococcaceae bacterium]|nr:hypothetical protein [Myxococcaceae bacterium]
MRRLWILGSLLVVGCAARMTTTPPPVVATTQAIVVVPVDEAPKHPHGQPPGQDPNFVPPGHGGVPPGQAKKVDGLQGVAAVSAAPATDAPGHDEKDKPKASEKGSKKAKGKAKDKDKK